MSEQLGNSLSTPTTSLAAEISPSDTSLIVMSAVSLPGTGTFRVRIGDELIEVGAITGTDLSSLTRGSEGTTAASHLQGAGVTLVLTAAGLEAYVAQNGGGGSSAIISDTDPGAVGAGIIWINTADPGFGIPVNVRPWLIRNETNDGWIEQGIIHRDDTGQIRAFITVSDGAIVYEKLDADGVQTGAFVLRDDAIYLTSNNIPIWLGSASDHIGANTWGISTPSGAEKFVAIPEPDDSELVASQNTKIVWYDGDTGESRFKFSTDSGGTVIPGKIAGLQPDGSAFLNVAPVDLSSATTVAEVVAGLVALGLATS